MNTRNEDQGEKMTPHEREMFDQYLALCRRIYERMRVEGFPWEKDLNWNKRPELDKPEEQ